MDKLLWKLDNATLAGGIPPRLDAITVGIRPGITAVLGPSGAGKTSLLNLLVAFESADEGSVTQAIETGACCFADGSCQDGGCTDGSCADEGAVEGEFREV